MKLLIVTHKVDVREGQGRVNFEIAHGLLAMGHSVTVVAEFCSPEIAQHPFGRFIPMREHRLPTQLLRNLYFAVKSGYWIHRHRGQFDLVQADGFVMWEPADIVTVHYVHTAWLRNASFPFRWSSFSLYAYYQRFLAILNAHLERHAFAGAGVLISVSRFTADEVIALGIPASKVRVVYNGVDVHEFHPGPPQRESFGLPAGVPLALFAGDIRTPRKNVDTTLKALCAVPDLHMVVAGKAEGSPYPEMAASLGLASRVYFIGLTRRLADLMRSVDLFVFPSRYESFGMVAVEAMATGLPMILSSRVGAAELAKSAALVVQDPDDVDGLSAAMRELLKLPDEARNMGERARQQVQNLQWSTMVEGYLQQYRELLDRETKESAGRVEECG